ncbi:hypothetical protein [Streptomyces sp. NPDC050982]|uniref:hypothetical protein n=1 Tax=Streptomyces sp. NPDC050982 TaxID=3154746 RepID=UPI0033D55969
MAAIVVVHGIGKQYLRAHTLQAGLAAPLIDGVLHAGAEPPGADDIRVAFYGHWFRPPGSPRKGEPAWTHRDVEQGYETELLLALWSEAVRTAPDRVPPPEPGAGSKVVTPQTVQRGLYALGRLLPARFTDRFLIGILKQVRTYLTDDTVRARVQEEIAAAVGPDTRVLVAHSLGSVIAYEALCAHPAWPVRALVTLGSPLGIPGLVFDRLNPTPVAGTGSWPDGVRQWTNLCDRGDVGALTKDLAPLFPGSVRDVPLRNGWQAHDIVPYLTAAETGAAIAAGLRP